MSSETPDQDEIPASRREAKRRGSKLYQTANPCSYGHYGPRYTTTGACLECGRRHSREYTEAHRKAGQVATTGGIG